MTASFGKMAAAARINAGLSQEQASVLLHVSVRTLSNYENDITTVPDETVHCMMKIYSCAKLGLSYLLCTSSVAQDLFSGIRFASGIASGALGLEVSTNDFLSVRDSFNRICLDDEISQEEQPMYEQCVQKIRHLIGTGISALIAIKKEPPARERQAAQQNLR